MTHTGNNPAPSVAASEGPVRLRLIVLILFLGIAALHIGSALMGKSLIRASHLGVALNYARGPIDLFRPMMPGFNANGVPTAQELPLWQAAAGLMMKLARSEWFGWGNITSLLLFATVLYPFMRLARRHIGEHAAWWALAFFLSQPIIVLMAGQASTDGFCLVSTIWFLYFADLMIASRKAWLVFPAAICAVIAALSKLPFFMAVGLCSVAILALENPRSLRTWALLASTGAVALIALHFWTQHTNHFADLAEYPYYDLRLAANPDLQEWFFGDLKTRLRPGLWVKGVWRFLHATLGVLPMLGVLIWALFTRGHVIPKVWLACAGIVTLIFTPVVLNHWHYFLMCCVPVAFLCGTVFASWEEDLCRGTRHLGTVVALAVFVGCAVNGLITMKIALDYDPFPVQMSAVLKKHTSPADKMLIYGEPGWGGEVLFRSGRQGLSVYHLETPQRAGKVIGLRELLSSPEHLARLKELQFTHLVLLSEPTVRFAVQASNPGAERQRILYPEKIVAEADAWPVVYSDSDIVIKRIVWR